MNKPSRAVRGDRAVPSARRCYAGRAAVRDAAAPPSLAPALPLIAGTHRPGGRRRSCLVCPPSPVPPSSTQRAEVGRCLACRRRSPRSRLRCSESASSAGASSRAKAPAARTTRTAGAQAQRGNGARRGSASSPATATAAPFTFAPGSAARGRSCSRFTTSTEAMRWSCRTKSSGPFAANTTRVAARNSLNR